MEFKLPEQIKKEHFINLVAVAFADGILRDEELNVLKDKAIEYGIAQKDVEEILKHKDKLEFIVPINDYEKEEQLINAVYMTMIDGEIHPKEYDLCLRIARRLDLDEKYLNKLIELVKELWNNEKNAN